MIEWEEEKLEQEYNGWGPLTVEDEFEISDYLLVGYLGNTSEITVPSGVRCIGKAAFQGKRFIKNIRLPDTVEIIADWAFENCNDLEQITISDSVKQIGYEAFARCYLLKEIIIPSSVERIDHSAFSFCGEIEKLQFTALVQLGDSVFYESMINTDNLDDQTALILYLCMSKGKIPDECRKIVEKNLEKEINLAIGLLKQRSIEKAYTKLAKLIIENKDGITEETIEKVCGFMKSIKEAKSAYRLLLKSIS